jgi:hypothetical protein
MADRKVTIPGQNVPIQIGTSINPDWYDKLKYLESLQPLSDVDFAAIDAAIALKSNILRSINDQTGTTYTFALTDSGKYCRFTNSGAVTVTVPPHSTVAFEAGTQIDLIQGGAGKVTLAQGSGVTINSLASYKALAGRYAGGTLVQTSTQDTWDLVGNLIA